LASQGQIMERIQTREQCQHPGFESALPSASDYCSDYCENAQKGGMDNECQCGHPECIEQKILQ
jgi:hypothetical protein